MEFGDESRLNSAKSVILRYIESRSHWYRPAMAVAPPSSSTPSSSGPRLPFPRQTRRRTSSQRPHLTTIEALPRPERPLWLRLLVGGQVCSVLLATGLVGATFVIYGMTVQTHRQLSTASRHLQQLQDQAQQLTAGRAVLRHHLAQDAGHTRPTDPARDVIFLEPAAVPSANPGTAETVPPSSPVRRPLGY